MATLDKNTDIAAQRDIIVSRCTAELAALGDSALAEQIDVVVRRAADDFVTCSEAAKLANVSQAAIKQWIGRGVLVAHQSSPRGRYRIDRTSLDAALNRRQQINEAKAAFAAPATAIKYISGLDAETIERLGGV